MNNSIDNSDNNLKIIKDNIYKIISNYIKVEKCGTYKFKAKCPFHREKTASFYINEKEGFYKCFGCNEGGDSINFVQKFLSLDFKNAFENCCSILNLKIINLTKRDSSLNKKEELYLKIMNLLKLFFKQQLKDNLQTVSQFLKKRELSNEIINDFEFGYFKDVDLLLKYCYENNINEKDLIDLGIIHNYNSNRYHSNYLNRFIIPIKNKRGFVIAFGARLLEDKDKQAKYINSSNSLIFKKNETLFNIDKAIKNKSNDLFFCEGYFDVVTLQKNDFNSVASLGTAVNENHIKDLFSLCGNVYICFDNDEAGKKATLNFIKLFFNIIKIEWNLKIVILEDFKDVDDFLKYKTKEDFFKLKDKALDPNEFVFEYFKSKTDLSKPHQKSKMMRDIKDLTFLIKDDIILKNYKEYFDYAFSTINYNKEFYLKDKKTLLLDYDKILQQRLKRILSIINENPSLLRHEDVIDLLEKIEIKELQFLLKKFEIREDIYSESSEVDKDLLIFLIKDLNITLSKQKNSKEFSEHRMSRKNILDKKRLNINPNEDEKDKNRN